MMFNNTSSGIPYYSRYSRYGYRYPYYTYQNYTNPYNNIYENKKQNVHNASIKNNAYMNANRINTVNKNNTSKVHTSINHNMQHDSINCNMNDSYNKNSESCSNETKDSPLFQLFGISLYFDDILLVCLIFFLYQEGVKDEGLFIALILLLLS